MRPSPLVGLVVSDRSAGIAGRYCARLFASLGARVFRDRPAARDDEIGYGGAFGEAFGAWLDQGKRIGSDDRADPPALIIVDADTPAELPSSPGSVRLDLSWFGDYGPYRDWKGSDAVMPALAGFAYSFGEPQGPPILPQGHAPQIVAGVTAFIAALAALVGRRRGTGTERVSTSIFEAAMCFSESIAVSYDHYGEKAARVGVNRFVPTYPCSNYRTADGWVGVTCLTPAQWEALTAMIGRPDLGADIRFRTSLDRLINGEAVDAVLAPFFAGRRTEELVLEGQERRIPMAPVPDLSDLVRTRHWAERGAFALLGDDGPMVPALPFRLAWDGHVRALSRIQDGAAPLAGIRVVDFSMGWAGPLTTRHLADLGADVIKIESEAHPDWWRGWERPEPGAPPTIELQPIFNVVNRGKRGITLDLRSEQGRSAARALIAEADIVLENLGPGVLAKLGFDPGTLHEIRPGLLLVSMGAFGSSGPWCGFRAYGSTVEQASGMPLINGKPDWPPSLQHIAYGDPVAGLYAAAAALAGLAGRERLGGCTIDLAQVECLFQLEADAIVACQLRQSPLPRTGSRRANLAPCACLATADRDGWVALACSDDAEWRSLCALIGRSEWAPLELADRIRRADAIERAIALWAEGRSTHEATEALQSVGISSAPVQPYEEMIRDPHLLATGFWLTLDRPFVGPHLAGAPPYRFDGERPVSPRPAPTLGQHNDEVLGSETEVATIGGGVR